MRRFQAFSRPFKENNKLVIALNKKQETQFIQRPAAPLQFSRTGLGTHALLTLVLNVFPFEPPGFIGSTGANVPRQPAAEPTPGWRLVRWRGAHRWTPACRTPPPAAGRSPPPCSGTRPPSEAGQGWAPAHRRSRRWCKDIAWCSCLSPSGKWHDRSARGTVAGRVHLYPLKPVWEWCYVP